MAVETKITRDYIDNTGIKEYVQNGLIEEYFGDIDVSLRTIGLLGYTTELISNCSEDVFNTGSVLFRESFPNRAQIPESIYSHASIFQLDDVMSKASVCKFLLVLEEAAILKNMVNDYDKDTGIYHFYIDKNTTIYVEDLPFTLDYDIKMNIVKKISDTGEDYLFTARYVTDDYTNSISDITNSYVKIRRSTDGYMALEVLCHQCYRRVRYETIITNDEINYPVIDINYDGKIAGFDILYTPPGSSSYQQMKPLIVYSQPLTTPFCYYQFLDNDKLRLTFNTKDLFFMPEFNSELRIIMYITEGANGKFDVYNGTDITLKPDNSTYAYANTYLTAAKPVGGSHDGQDQLPIEALQSLAVEGYRTANALTTENDLQEYFSNYKYRFNDVNILFIKKRDDVYERVYSAFLVFNDGNYIYNTNTLNIKLNLFDMKNPEKDIFMLDPGYLFTSNDTSGYAEFVRDRIKYVQYYDDYLEAVKQGKIDYIDSTVTDHSELPPYLDRPASFAEYKSRRGVDDKLSVFDIDQSIFDEKDVPTDNKFLLFNPFLIRFTKNPNIVSTYMTYVQNTSVLDFTDQNDDSYLQFIMSTLTLDRKFEKEKKYYLNTVVLPSITVDREIPVIQVEEAKQTQTGILYKYKFNDKYTLDKNDLRVFFVIMDGNSPVCYTEMYPTGVKDEDNYIFSAEIFTDDHITTDGRLRILPCTIERNKETGEYYKVHEDDKTLYDHYDKNDSIIERDISVNVVTELHNTGKLYTYHNTVNMSASHEMKIPLDSVTCRIYTLYRRVYKPELGQLAPATEEQTDNLFVDFDKSLKGYVWTNMYSTASSPITFIKPLDSVRTYLKYEDYTEAVEDKESGKILFTHDIMDVQMYSLSFLRASLYKNEDRLDSIMNTFYATYNHLNEIMEQRLRNVTNFDVKFYNTYGRSKNFIIGENNELLDTVNLKLKFDVWFVQGTDLLYAVPEVKDYIRLEVESINGKGMNNLFISNLMRKIETKFSYVDHIRFVQINDYDSTYQAVKNRTVDLNDLPVEDRRFYVPELLVCDSDDITITEYFV